MREAHLHALISLPNEGHWDQFGADTRYITQIGGTQTEVGAVLPLEGDVTAVVRGANEIEWWGLAQDWVKDIRPSRRSYGEPVSNTTMPARLTRAYLLFEPHAKGISIEYLQPFDVAPIVERLIVLQRALPDLFDADDPRRLQDE